MRNVTGDNQNIQFLQVGYPSNGSVGINPAPANMQLYTFSFSAYNGTGSQMDVGLAVSRAVNKLYQLQSGVASLAVFPATLFTTTNNDGFLVEAPKPFGYLSFNISQAGTGTPVFAYSYYNGTSFVALNVTQAPVYSATGMVHVTFNPPIDWVKGDGGLTANNLYSIKVIATTAPTLAVKASSSRTASWIYYERSLASLGRVQASFATHPLLLESGEALLPYFSVADPQNVVEAAYQVMP